MLASARRAGVLCHITSLPGDRNGTLGDDALRFLDFMQRAGLSIWQMLPLNPPDRIWLAVPQRIVVRADEALLDPALGLDGPERVVDATRECTPTRSIDSFAHSAYWLDDYCRFSVLPRPIRSGLVDAGPWRCGGATRTRLPDFDAHSRAAIERCALRAVRDRITDSWRLRKEAAARGVLLFGDLPLYPAYESADVWAHQDIFLLDAAPTAERSRGRAAGLFLGDGSAVGQPDLRVGRAGCSRILRGGSSG